MSDASDHRPSSASAGPENIQRRVRLMAVLGILLTSTVIGGIGTYLLYKSQAATLANQLFFAIELQAATMEGELARLTNIAAQVASRTRIRQELERYQHGEIDKATLVGFTVPKLTDAMQSNADVVGITRLTDERIPVIEVGRPIDPSLWPHEIQDSETVVGLPRDGFIVVSAPIRNRKQQTVGTDLVMFRDDRLNQVMQGFFTHIETVGSVQIATLERGLAMHFYDVGEMQPTLPDEALKIELMEMFQLGVDDGMHRPSSGDHSHLVVAHRHIGQSGWAFLYYADHWDFYADARTHALFAVFTVFALATLGIALTNRVIQPLVSRVAVETRNLQRLLQHNEELLTAVQTNEAKLQAVIDYAPAIIYIKDHAGRYLLVNSSYEKLVGLPREQIVGKFDYELFPDDIAKSTRDTDLEVLATGKPITIDEKAPQRDGIHDFLSIKFPLLDASGEVSSVCGISTDITERKTVERRLALTQHTVDQANVGVVWADQHGQFLYVNDSALALLQIDHGNLPHTNLVDISATLDHAGWQAHWREICRRGHLHYETLLVRGDGSEFPVEVHANSLTFGDRHYYIAILHDITGRRSSERRLRQSATVFDCTAEAIMIADPDGTVVDINPAFTDILGYSREEVIGQTPALWKSELHDRAFYRDLWRSIEATGHWRGEIMNRNKDGSVTPELVTINAVYDDAGRPINYVAIYTDITQMKQSQAQLAHLAHHDPLTNLPNRVLFYERLQHGLDRAARRGGSVGVVFVDLDHFKNVNDSLGHTAGDQLLKEVAQLLRSTLRNDDTVARIGGDEFTILIEEVDDRDRLMPVIEKIIVAFDREFRLGKSSVRVTPSIGASLSPDDGIDADTLMRNADAAMYRAKSLGRNTYQFYTEELTRQAFSRIRIDGALRKALAEDEFELYYQPQVDLRSGRVVGMEALIRWYNDDLGQVSPEQFIPIAEDNSMILPLGEWILQKACRQASAWLDAGLLTGTLAVNISGVQLRRGDLVNLVSEVLRESGLPADKLELEVTESFIMGESGHAIRTLEQLRDLGVTLAVDDFGTGYSSLSYLKSLPIHRLKIDKSFIRDIPDDPNDMAITRAVIALGKSLNLELIGEGVETETQHRFLLDEGCVLAQGFLFHRPLSSDDMYALLSEQRQVQQANQA